MARTKQTPRRVFIHPKHPQLCTIEARIGDPVYGQLRKCRKIRPKPRGGIKKINLEELKQIFGSDEEFSDSENDQEGEPQHS